MLHSQPTGEKTHTNQQCERLAKIWQTTSGRLMNLLDLSPADFRRFLTVLVDRRLVLFEYGTGCEWHPSNQALQCPVVMIRCGHGARFIGQTRAGFCFM
jgi:hypothetical protein